MSFFLKHLALINVRLQLQNLQKQEVNKFFKKLQVMLSVCFIEPNFQLQGFPSLKLTPNVWVHNFLFSGI